MCYIQLSIYEFHIMEAFVVVPFIWVQLIQQQHAKPWDSSHWCGTRLTGGKQPCCLHHNMTPKDERGHWKGLIGNHAKDTQEAVIQSWCMLSSKCIHTVNRKAYNQLLPLCFFVIQSAQQHFATHKKAQDFTVLGDVQTQSEKGGSCPQILLI